MLSYKYAIMSMYRMKSAFSLQLKQSFNCFTINKLFKDAKPRIIVGHEDGMVRTYDIPDNDKFQQNPDIKACYETKGGPIQALLVEDLTNLLINDLVVANSGGQVIFFCKEQIMARNDIFNHSITDMILIKDAAGVYGILARDLEGSVCFFDPHDEIWRMRHGDGKFARELFQSSKMTCIYHAVLNTSHGSKAGYILVADDSKRLSIYFNNNLILVLTTPSIVTAMCAGRFVDEEHFEGVNSKVDQDSSPYTTQVVLGSDDGSLCILANFQVYPDEMINIQFPVRHLCRYPGGKVQSNGGLDLIVAAGNVDCYCVIKDGKEVVRQKTPSWVTSIFVKDVDNDGFEEVVFSCRDLSIHAHKMLSY